MRLKLFFVLILFSSASHAQKKPSSGVDALMQKISQMKDDTVKVNAYLTNSTDFVYKNERALILFNAANDLAKKLHYNNGIVKAELALAGWYNDRADYIQALAHNQIALKTAPKNSISLAYSLYVSRTIYRELQDFKKVTDCDLQALKICLQSKNDTLVFNSYVSLASDYGDWKKYHEALIYAQKGRMLAEKVNSQLFKGVSYSVLGWVYFVLKNYEPALQYNKRSLEILGEADQNSVNTISTLGEIYRDMPDSSLIKTGLSPKQRDALVLQYFKKALKGSLKTGVLSWISENYLKTSQSYARVGDFKEAYQSYQNSVLYRDSSANEKQQKQIIQAEAHERETALKYQQQLANIKSRQQRNYYLGGIATLLLTSFFVARNYFIQRKLNRLISIEKQRSDNLLNNILPFDVAEELKQKGEAKARHFNNVTVLFTDFVQFTTVSEQLTPQQLVDELNVCFKAFDHIMTANNIEKIKTVGDAYLAVAGLPNADASHAHNVVKAAIAIREFMLDRKAALGDGTFNIRIGIHSGSVVAGIVGVNKFAYDIWGDTVNTAARMEQNSQPGKINISETTRQLLGNDFGLTYRGEIEAKNKGLLKMYFVA